MEDIRSRVTILCFRIPGISILLLFEFGSMPVYYAKYAQPMFPSDGTKCLGRFAKIAESEHTISMMPKMTVAKAW